MISIKNNYFKCVRLHAAYELNKIYSIWSFDGCLRVCVNACTLLFSTVLFTQNEMKSVKLNVCIHRMKGNNFISFYRLLAIPSMFYGFFSLFMSKSFINKNKSNKFLLLYIHTHTEWMRFFCHSGAMCFFLTFFPFLNHSSEWRAKENWTKKRLTVLLNVFYFVQLLL